MASYPIYLDYNATTPLDPSVMAEIQNNLNVWGNPSSNYSIGLSARSVIESSRNCVAEMINAKPEDIVFTSGGTEANNTALRSAVYLGKANAITKPHVITSNVEHDSVIKVLVDFEKSGIIDLSIVEVIKATGCLSPSTVLSLINDNTSLISIMHANNETGLIMPIEEIASELKAINAHRGSKELPHIYFHTDAAQTVGKISVNVQDLGVDYLTIVGHKFYGPRIGALYAKGIGKETPLLPIVLGGGQERGYRPGTENTPMIAGLGKAAKLVAQNLFTYESNMEKCRSYLANELQANINDLSLNFDVGKRLPNTLSVRFPDGILAASVLKNCNEKVLASLGAACHSLTETASGILISSGLSQNEAQRTVRMSVGRTTTTEEIDLAVKAIIEACSA